MPDLRKSRLFQTYKEIVDICRLVDQDEDCNNIYQDVAMQVGIMITPNFTADIINETGQIIDQSEFQGTMELPNDDIQNGDIIIGSQYGDRLYITKIFPGVRGIQRLNIDSKVT